MNDRNIIVGILIALVGVGAVLFSISGSSSPTGANLSTSDTPAVASGPNLPLAQCLKDKGATFYGAFWCPHCRSQKALFGDAVSALPYVECSKPDQSQNQLCADKKITSYPTWEFADGSRLTGEVPLAKLAASSSCSQILSGKEVEDKGTSSPVVGE